MSTRLKPWPARISLHRALGALWALLGVACLYDLAARDYWQDRNQSWLPLLIGILYFCTGIGFFKAHKWAGWMMWGLVVFAAYVFFTWVLLGLLKSAVGFGSCGAAGLALAAYTIRCLVLSAEDRRTQP
jgi:hypothetical protein